MKTKQQKSKTLKQYLKTFTKEELNESLNEFSIIIIEIGREIRRRK